MYENNLLQYNEVFPHHDITLLLGMLGMVDVIGEANFPEEMKNVHTTRLDDINFVGWFSCN